MLEGQRRQTWTLERLQEIRGWIRAGGGGQRGEREARAGLKGRWDETTETAWKKKKIQGHLFLDLAFKHLNKKKSSLDCEEEGFGFHGCKTKTDWMWGNFNEREYCPFMILKALCVLRRENVFTESRLARTYNAKVWRNEIHEVLSAGTKPAGWPRGGSFYSSCIKMCLKYWPGITLCEAGASQIFLIVFIQLSSPL